MDQARRHRLLTFLEVLRALCAVCALLLTVAAVVSLWWMPL